MNGCKVTLFNQGVVGKGAGNGTGRTYPTCGEPVVAHGLCERHLAERVRLGGAS